LVSWSWRCGAAGVPLALPALPPIRARMSRWSSCGTHQSWSRQYRPRLRRHPDPQLAGGPSTSSGDLPSQRRLPRQLAAGSADASAHISRALSPAARTPRCARWIFSGRDVIDLGHNAMPPGGRHVALSPFSASRRVDSRALYCGAAAATNQIRSTALKRSACALLTTQSAPCGKYGAVSYIEAGMTNRPRHSR